jgi:hypothetical protein
MMINAAQISQNIISYVKYSIQYAAHGIANLRLSTMVEHPITTALIAGTFVICVLSLVMPQRGTIIPIGTEMKQAYSMLQSTPTGRALINKVELSSKGNYVYMVLGTTDTNKLFDPSGRKVRGVTRAFFHVAQNNFIPQSIIVYTNRDITFGEPSEIVKSMAFELENVIYSMKYPNVVPGLDSPYAQLTQKRICDELDL